MELAHLAPQIALALGAAAALVVAMVVRHERQWWSAVVAAIGLVVAGATALDLTGAAPRLTFTGAWALDGPTLWTTVIVVLLTLVTLGLCPAWFRTDPRHGELYALVTLAALGATVIAGAADLNQLIVGLVLVTATGYVLAAYHRRSSLSVEAGMRFFLIGALANALLLVGAALLYGLAGTTRYPEAAAALDVAPTVGLVAATTLLVVGLAFELGAVPAHAWLPDVAEGSPAPTAAFLTVVPKLGALVATARLVALLPADQVGWRPLVAVIALATMTLGNLAALWQDDLRRLLGWSSVSQAGYALLGVVAIGRSEQALPSLLLFGLAYGLANLAAFGVVVALRGRTAIADHSGLLTDRPWLAVALIVALLSLVGIPPLGGFTAKVELFTAAIESGYAWLAAAAVANTVLSLAYYLRVIAPMVLRPAGGAVAVLDRTSQVTVAVATLGVAAVGVLTGPILVLFGALATATT